jgi:hypothetical protein
MIKQAHFQYKCRRCGVIEENPHCGLPNKNEGITRLVNAINNTPLGPQAPQLLDVHFCDDGGSGISDLLGYRVSVN